MNARNLLRQPQVAEKAAFFSTLHDSIQNSGIKNIVSSQIELSYAQFPLLPVCLCRSAPERAACFGLRVEFLLKTESGYLRDAEVT